MVPMHQYQPVAYTPTGLASTSYYPSWPQASGYTGLEQQYGGLPYTSQYGGYAMVSCLDMTSVLDVPH